MSIGLFTYLLGALVGGACTYVLTHAYSRDKGEIFLGTLAGAYFWPLAAIVGIVAIFSRAKQ